MLCADATIIGVTLAFGGGMVVEGGQVQRRGVKEEGPTSATSAASAKNHGEESVEEQAFKEALRGGILSEQCL
jgi:hypothetical protein